jgi:hypothetical protein
VLQDATTPNSGAGLCLNIAARSAQVLAAQGNTWVATGTPAANVDCSMTAGALSEGAGATGRACAGTVDVGGSGLQGAVTPNGVAVNLCTCGGLTTCR